MVARALEREDHLVAGPGFELVQGQGQGLLHQTVDLQAPGCGIDHRPVVVRNAEELLVGRNPRVHVFPCELIGNHLWHRVFGRLIQPGEHFFACPQGKGVRRQWRVEQPQASQGGTSLGKNARRDMNAFGGCMAALSLSIKCVDAKSSRQKFFLQHFFPACHGFRGLHRLSTTLSPRHWQRAWQKGTSPGEENLTLSMQIQNIFVEFL